jgi:hypothetical protein
MNKNLNQKPIMDSYAKWSKTTAGEFCMGGWLYGMVFQFEATLRPSMRIFEIYAWR